MAHHDVSVAATEVYDLIRLGAIRRGQPSRSKSTRQRSHAIDHHWSRYALSQGATRNRYVIVPRIGPSCLSSRVDGYQVIHFFAFGCRSRDAKCNKQVVDGKVRCLARKLTTRIQGRITISLSRNLGRETDCQKTRSVHIHHNPELNSFHGPSFHEPGSDT